MNPDLLTRPHQGQGTMYPQEDPDDEELREFLVYSRQNDWQHRKEQRWHLSPLWP